MAERATSGCDLRYVD